MVYEPLPDLPAACSFLLGPTNTRVTRTSLSRFLADEASVGPIGRRRPAGPKYASDIAVASDHEWFKDEFCRSVKALETWLARQRLLPAGQGLEAQFPLPTPGNGLFGRPGYDFIVSEVANLPVSAKSLEHAYRGHRGVMEFRDVEIHNRTSGILHELVHVYLPNGNRLLAEGLAVYLQSLLSNVPSLPNNNVDLYVAASANNPTTGHAPACRVGIGIGPGTCNDNRNDNTAPLPTGNRDRIMVPDPLGGQDDYIAAGAFVRYLIEMEGMAKFRQIYERTPLIVGATNQTYDIGRWMEAYGKDLGTIVREWRTFLTENYQSSCGG
jgi:hypothetical protein